MSVPSDHVEWPSSSGTSCDWHVGGGRARSGFNICMNKVTYYTCLCHIWNGGLKHLSRHMPMIHTRYIQVIPLFSIYITQYVDRYAIAGALARNDTG